MLIQVFLRKRLRRLERWFNDSKKVKYPRSKQRQKLKKFRLSWANYSTLQIGLIRQKLRSTRLHDYIPRLYSHHLSHARGVPAGRCETRGGCGACCRGSSPRHREAPGPDRAALRPLRREPAGLGPFQGVSDGPRRDKPMRRTGAADLRRSRNGNQETRTRGSEIAAVECRKAARSAFWARPAEARKGDGGRLKWLRLSALHPLALFAGGDSPGPLCAGGSHEGGRAKLGAYSARRRSCTSGDLPMKEQRGAEQERRWIPPSFRTLRSSGPGIQGRHGMWLWIPGSRANARAPE